MRIQYRYRQLTMNIGGFYGGSNTSSMTPWFDAPADGTLPSHVAIVGELQVRIVDDKDFVVPQTPAFKPAFYQRRGRPNGRPGGITWCTEAPSSQHWIRRDDIKP